MSNPTPPPIYSVDSSSLMDWQARNYPTDVFAGLIANIDALIAADRFVAPALVKEEIGAVGTTELIDWTENQIDFYIDETMYHSVKRNSSDDFNGWPFDQRFHLILNLAGCVGVRQ